MICVFIIKNVYKSIPNEKKKSTAKMRFTKNVIKTLTNNQIFTI